MGGATQTLEFQAETKKLLDIVIHSLYTDKEIFLRELISNASDALDRLRFEALTKPELLGEDEQLEIRLESDQSSRTLTISDNGIGMGRQEVIDNLGTIAKSGTKELIEKLRESKSESGQAIGELIGQFGVGFYSAFMVADQVEVLTHRAGEDGATRWISQADGTYTVEDGRREGRGTTITMHLKPVDSDQGIEDFTEHWVLSRLVKRYSDFVSYPIINKERREEEERDEEGKIVEGGKKTVVYEDKTLNSMKPLWTRPKDEVKQDEYDEFYKHVSHDWEKPMRTLRFRAEGVLEYEALLFLPSKAPYDMTFHAYEYGLRLYARRVLIMERCEDLLPRYLRFVRGIVDSSDLPLNISRQRLQNDRHITQMRKWLTKKILDELGEMQKGQEKDYVEFWKQFGTVLKESIGVDHDNKDKISPLLLFPSSGDPKELTSLKQYKERMQEGQTAIYYLTGENRSLIENSPHLESFKKKGFEVLYLTEPVDELVMQSLHEFDGTPIQSAAKGDLDLEEEDKDQDEEVKKQREKRDASYKGLLEYVQKQLDARIKEVRLSKRLTSSPVCLVGGEMDNSPYFERMMQRANIPNPKQRRIMELNPDSPIVTGMRNLFAANPEDPALKDYAELLMGYGLIAEGSELLEPSRFNQLLAGLLTEKLGSVPPAPEAEAAPEPADSSPAQEAEAAESAPAGNDAEAPVAEAVAESAPSSPVEEASAKAEPGEESPQVAEEAAADDSQSSSERKD